jgi:hypothetical protein
VAQIVQFLRPDRGTWSSPIAVPLAAMRVEVSALDRFNEDDSHFDIGSEVADEQNER